MESTVQKVGDGSFGFVIAYLVPGLVALSAISDFLPSVDAWFGFGSSAPTVGGFLYGTLGSIATGLTLSAIRSMTLDRIHHATGIPSPNWDFARLQQHLPAFQGAVENHYRYYQFYGNMLLALVLIPIAPNARSRWLSAMPGWIIGTTLLVVYFHASRDALSKYYARTAAMLVPCSSPEESKNDERLASCEENVSTFKATPQASK